MKKAFVVLSAMLLLTIMACGGGDSTPLPLPLPIPLSSAKAITAFALNGVVGTINETGKTIAVAMPSGTNVTALVATFTTTGDSVKVGSTLQQSGTTANNYTSPVIYTVTAEDATTQNYTVTVTVPALLVFVTSTTGSSILSSWADAGGATGVAAGDNICQARATAAGLPGTYKAWLSDNTTDAYCHIQGYTGKISADCGQVTLPVAAGPWVRTNDGYPFAGTIDNLVNNGQVYAPVRYDENGALAPAEYYFTGTEADGTVSTQNCGNWTIGSGDDALSGVKGGTTESWTAGSGGECGSTGSLLCFQTGAGEPLPAITAPALSKKVFVTSVSGTGDLSTWADAIAAGSATGIAAGDAICVARATAASIPNAANFKAWLSTDAVDAKDHITSDGPWYRLDGVKVADSKAALLNAGTVPLFTSIAYTDTGLYIYYPHVWSGTTDLGSNTAGYNCTNWTGTGGNGTWGVPSYTVGGWTEWSTSTCSQTRVLYCFEDE